MLLLCAHTQWFKLVFKILTSSKKTYSISFICPNTWISNGDGRIYNISEDLQELDPIDEAALTSEQKQIIDEFKAVLTNMK